MRQAKLEALASSAADRYEVSPCPTVSILIPIRNEEAFLGACLRALIAQDYPESKTEIIIIDGHSTDHTKLVARQWTAQRANVLILDNPRELTSAGLNIGLQAARGEIIARVDGHCQIAPDYISQCVRALQETGAECVGGTLRPRGIAYWEQVLALALTSRFGVGDSQYHFSTKPQYVDQVYLGAVPRAVLARLGGFDESLVRNQDYELNYRIRAAGGRIYLSPKIRSSYRPRNNLKSLARQYFEYGYWKLRMLSKHPRSVRARQVIAPIFVLLLLLILLASTILPALIWLEGILVGSYLGANLLASLLAVRQHDWRYALGLPFAFATMHLSWGAGFLSSLVMLPLERSTGTLSGLQDESVVNSPASLQAMSLSPLLASLRRSWWVFCLTTFVAIIAALLPLYLAPPIYASTAKFVVNPSKTLAASREILDSVNPSNIHTIASTFAQVLGSDDFYAQAAAQLRLSDQDLAGFSRSTVILPDTAVVQLRVQGDDPQEAAEIANDIGQEAVTYADRTYRIYQFDFLDHAIASAAPISLPWMRNLLLALVIGFGSGALLMVLREQLASSVQSIPK